MYFQGLVEEGDTTVSGLLDFGIRTGNVEQFHMGLHRAAAWRVVCLYSACLVGHVLFSRGILQLALFSLGC